MPPMWHIACSVSITRNDLTQGGNHGRLCLCLCHSIRRNSPPGSYRLLRRDLDLGRLIGLVWLVYLVYLVDLVCLVCLVCFVVWFKKQKNPVLP